MKTLFGVLPARAVLLYPVVALLAGFVQAKLLALFRSSLGAGMPELMIVLGWLALTASRPHWLTTPWRWAALAGIQTVEPVALAVPAVLGQLAVVTLAWTSRPWAPHPLDALQSLPVLAVIAFSLIFTVGTFGPLGALPLGLVAVLCLVFHWYGHERLGGATAPRLFRAGDCAECAALTFSAWLF